MRPYAEVIGDPIAHSKSPALHGFWLQGLGLNCDYRATQIRRDQLGEYFEERRRDPTWRGCNLTAPLKEEAITFLDGLSEAAKAIGAVNIVHRNNGLLIGDNSDVDGIRAALPRELVEGRAVAIIGAGGAARAALHHLIKSGAKKVRIVTRRPARKLAIACDGNCRIKLRSIADPSCLARANLFVNASPLGMAHAPMPGHLLKAISQKRQGTVFDMVYEPLATELLRTAKQSGLQTVDGLTMLIGQADKSFQCFFGVSPPRARDRELRDLLAGISFRLPIVLVGLPGSGKSTIGPALAARLGLDFADSDERIEQQAGMSIFAIFEQQGETKFRAIEREVILKLVTTQRGVIALGGGALADPTTRVMIKQHCTSIWLDAPLDILHARLKTPTERPLLSGDNILKTLHVMADARQEAYAAADIHVLNLNADRTIDQIHCALQTKDVSEPQIHD
jgi:shikimate dehydrogenase